MTTGAPTPPYSARPRRSRLLTFLPLGVAAWLVLEIWLLTVVAGAASGFAVFLLLVAGFVFGAVVIKRAGRRAFRALSEALQQQQSGALPQGRASCEGNGLMMLGGLLLMIPGLVSDAGRAASAGPAGSEGPQPVRGAYLRAQDARGRRRAPSVVPSSRPVCTVRTARSSRARSFGTTGAGVHADAGPRPPLNG